MITSCLNHTLISSSVAGTGTNVTLLIQALTPLCPKLPPPMEIAANHIITIVIGYVCGFLPWGFISLFDFTSAKWKTVRNTRRLGYFHLCASVIPMVFVIVYAVLQGVSGDYKEMMTAILAAVLIMHHVLRTLWGLVQLQHYVAWCYETLQCIKATKPVDWSSMWNSSDEDEDEESTNLDKNLMVNEEIVDNEFSGRDVSVSYSFSNGSMGVSNPEVCTIRWAAAFLCSLGHKWKSMGSKPLPERLSRYITSSLFYIDESKRGSPAISFDYLSQAVLLRGANCGAYASNISAYLGNRRRTFESFQFEFENIVSSYPPCNESRDGKLVEQNRADARVELVNFVLAARMLGSQKLRAFASQSNQLRAAFLCHEQFWDAFDLLQDQLCIEKPINITDVHWFWKLAMVPCFIDNSNAFMLQPSVQVDNTIALVLGESMSDNEDGKINMLIRKEQDNFKDRIQPLVKSPRFTSGLKYILGASLDQVRKLLAEWVLRSNELLDARCWCPSLSQDPLCFALSSYLVARLQNLSRHNLALESFEFVLAECQVAIQRNVVDCTSENIELPRSTAMIALLLLSYPALDVKKQESPGESKDDVLKDSMRTIELRIQPIAAPQNLWLTLIVYTDSGMASLHIAAENYETQFYWENWINSAMQIVKSYNQIAKNEIDRQGKSRFRGPLDLIKYVNLSRPMCTLNYNSQDNVLSQLPGTLHVWTAWPMFDVRFCQFEMGQWMDACRSLSDDSDEVDVEYGRQRIAAKETLTSIASWNTM